MNKIKKNKIAFFIGAFPAISESWFIEQLAGLIDMGAKIDIFSFKKGGKGNISEKVQKYDLINKTTYLEYPNSWFKRISIGLYFFLKIILLKPSVIFNYYIYTRSNKQKFTLKYLFWIGPIVNKINNYYLIHCHFGMIGNRFLIIRKILKLKQKIVVTFYGQDSSKYIQQKGLRVYDNLKRESSYFLLMTQEMKERFVKLEFPVEKLLVHYTGVNMDNYIFNFKTFKRPNVFRIITVGRFVEKKGLEDALRAIKIAVKEYNNIELNIVGGGEKEYKDKLMKMVSEMGLEKNVKFLGLLPHQETISLFRKMHVMLQMSKRAKNGDTDDLPFVILESQASGLPVITTRHVGIPDGICDKKTGYIVREGDYNEASEKIMYLINNPELLQNFSYSAAKFVKNKFDLKKLNQKLIFLYKSL
ncbi:glycosyltransferase [Candidatus Parcubacteria bacterium]|nr:glycosyltransferase [Candidatus Parcubacteria bacterium]